MAVELDITQIAAGAGDAISRVYFRRVTASTNNDALLLAKQGASAGTVVVAGEQTAGRGRRQAKWHAKRGETLCFSVIVAADDLALPTSLVAGEACAEAISQLGVEIDLKWPNDLYFGGKKLGGILVEREGGVLVVGVGINHNVASFPAELEMSATCLRRAGCVATAEQVLAGVLARIGRYLVERERADIDILNDFRRRCWLTGRSVRLQSGGQDLEGIVKGIGDGGELLLWTGQTTRVLISAEQIRVV